MPFTLTLLGTDTQYKPASYLRSALKVAEGAAKSGETLSYISTRIQGLPIVDVDVTTEIDLDSSGVMVPKANYPSYFRTSPAYETNQSAVINGPQTLGSDVYQKIAEGVCCLLNAIVNNPDGEPLVLNIIGHSRGAVESIIVAHEMQRLKTLFAEIDDINSVADLKELIAKPANNRNELANQRTSAALNSLINQSDLDKDFVKVKTKLLQAFKDDTMGINIYALDPVPGGRVLGMGAAKWDDQRYFSVPPIVRDFREILLVNERSRGFKAIIPRVEDSSKTKFSLLDMPGHHGTASGNPRAHDLRDTGDASHVQFITLYELHDFLSEHGVTFQQNQNESICDVLDPLFSAYNNAPLTEKRTIVSQTYAKVIENIDAYTAFNKTYYPTGIEGGVKTIFGYEANKSRIVHRHNGADTFIDSIVSFKVDGFVNHKHALSYILSRPELQAEERAEFDGPVGQLTLLNTRFDSRSTQLNDLLGNNEISPILINSFVELSLNMVQTYLSNNLESSQKSAIETALSTLFSPGTNAAQPSAMDAFRSALQKAIAENVLRLVATQVDSHFNDLRTLRLSPSFNDDLDAFITKAYEKHQQFTQYITHLTELAQIDNVWDSSAVEELNTQQVRMKSYADVTLFFSAQAMVIDSTQVNSQTTINQEHIISSSFLADVRKLYYGLNNRAKLLEEQLLDRIADYPKADNELSKLEEQLGQQRNARRAREAEFAALNNYLQQDINHAALDGLSFHVLGGFCTVLGVAAVAISLAALSMGSLGVIPAVALIATGTALASIGFFCTRKGAELDTQRSLFAEMQARMPAAAV